METQNTSQIVVFSRPDYSLAAIAAFLETPADMIWALTDEKSIKIDSVRRLQQELSTSPATAQTRHVAVFPAERITEQAQQALLKLIEEPPPNTQISLITTSISQVLPTIQSRCIVRTVTFTEQLPTDTTFIFPRLQQCQSWKDVVTLSQSLPTKREELRQQLRNEYRHPLPQTPLAITFKEILSDVLEALNQNVQPALCTETLLFTAFAAATENTA